LFYLCERQKQLGQGGFIVKLHIAGKNPQPLKLIKIHVLGKLNFKISLEICFSNHRKLEKTLFLII